MKISLKIGLYGALVFVTLVLLNLVVLSFFPDAFLGVAVIWLVALCVFSILLGHHWKCHSDTQA